MLFTKKIQPPTTTYNYPNYYPQNNHTSAQKRIPTIIAIIALIIIILTITCFSILSLNQPDSSNANNSSAETTPTLQAYNTLDEGVSIYEIQNIVSKINSDFIVTIDEAESAGKIALSNTNEVITFYYIRDDLEEEFIDEELSEEEIEEETEPNTAFGIKYEKEIDNVYHCIYYEPDTQLFIYSDEEDFYSFNTKQEAIEAFLSSNY